MIIPLLTACDPEGKKQCAWVLEVEPQNKDKVEAGKVPVCVRNRQTFKQDCRLQTDLEFAKRAYNKKFRYVDMKVENYALPRTIKSVQFCDP